MTPSQQSPISRETVSTLCINRGLTVITQPFCPSTRLSALIDELAGERRSVKQEDRPLTKQFSTFHTSSRQLLAKILGTDTKLSSRHTTDFPSLFQPHRLICPLFIAVKVNKGNQQQRQHGRPRRTRRHHCHRRRPGDRDEKARQEGGRIGGQ